MIIWTSFGLITIMTQFVSSLFQAKDLANATPIQPDVCPALCWVKNIERMTLHVMRMWNKSHRCYIYFMCFRFMSRHHLQRHTGGTNSFLREFLYVRCHLISLDNLWNSSGHMDIYVQCAKSRTQQLLFNMFVSLKHNHCRINVITLKWVPCWRIR